MKDEAFGIIPVVKQEVGHLFLLVQQNKGTWGFPKGHAEGKESAIQAACREFEEETGIRAYTLVDDFMLTEKYSFTRNRQAIAKTVQYFLAFVHSTTVTTQPEEIQNYQWLPFEEAFMILNFECRKQILHQAHQYLTTFRV